MALTICPPEDFSPLVSVAREFCPFPDYNPSPLFINMLSANSSLQLMNHYTGVQTSLTPSQLEDFTQSLKTTFGREGRVTLGGVGVVALSLAVLFDTLAKQVRGEWVSESGPIPGLFYKNLRGYYPPHVYTISEYLRLVPHIANNPTRMKEETESYIKRLAADDRSLSELGGNHSIPIYEDITVLNLGLGRWFANSLEVHLLRMKNGTAEELGRSKGMLPPVLVYNLNCDPEAADKDFVAQVLKSESRAKWYFKRYLSTGTRKTKLLQVAELEWINARFQLSCGIGRLDDSRIAQREDFDLKANALGNWAG